MLGLKMLKGYITLAVAILTVVLFVILSGIGEKISMEYIVLNILVILLTGAVLLNSIIQIHIFEEAEKLRKKFVDEKEE